MAEFCEGRSSHAQCNLNMVLDLLVPTSIACATLQIADAESCFASEAQTYSQSGSRSRGFLRWLKRMQVVQPEYIQLPVRQSKSDPTRKFEKWSVVSPMSLALYLREKRPELLFCDEQQQQLFMGKSGTRFQTHTCRSDCQLFNLIFTFPAFTSSDPMFPISQILEFFNSPILRFLN